MPMSKPLIGKVDYVWVPNRSPYMCSTRGAASRFSRRVGDKRRIRMRGTQALLPCLVSTVLAVTLAAREPVRARHGMVVANEPIAADVGVSVLQKGGNAIDAAVAVGFAMAVTDPWAGNIGGGGYMLIRLGDGRTTAIEFRERAPQSASRDMYLDANGNPTEDSLKGWRSSGVPGTVRGFELALSKYGRRPWAEVLEPAVTLAAKGFRISYALAKSLKGARNLSRSPDSKRIFQKNGAYYDVGETLVQPELAQTLGRIARGGANDFYEGQTATRLANEMTKHGGLITLADLRSYRAVERTPLTGPYRNYTIITAPPSSSGGIALLEMMGILQGTDYEKDGAGSASAIHYAAEVMRRAYADRNTYVGDPDFVKVPIAGLLDPAYLARLRSTIHPALATPSDSVRPGRPVGSESMETTHYSVVDREGNAVSVTYTIAFRYGNGITVPGLGFLLNNEMGDFASKPGTPNVLGLVQGNANAIQPGKRPLSSMTPTIVLRDGQLFMTVGGQGGPQVSTAVMQVILNVIDFGMNIQDAVDFPRFHHQWLPDTLLVDQRISPDTVDLLASRGYKVKRGSSVRWNDPDVEAGPPPMTSNVVAAVNAIVRDEGGLHGAADGRGDGKAVGY
jgi:gamma-glutamyltranspeptidase / glutathione hydrolase